MSGLMTNATPISDDELVALFAGLERTPLALAVSGGADSMALMHMVARWARREEVKAAYRVSWDLVIRPLHPPPHTGKLLVLTAAQVAGTREDPPPHVVVLTVDHGLRAESADEADFVRREAQSLGLQCKVLRWEGEKPATGIQAAARTARRELLVDAIEVEAEQLTARLKKHGLRSRGVARRLVMAHHQEDQAETVLMRLARGSGLEGLGGMRWSDTITRDATRAYPKHFQAQLRRPLLDMPKARLVSTLQSYGGRWVEDPSNDDERFERVRVRKMMPLIAAIGLTAEKIALSARRLRDADAALMESSGPQTIEESALMVMAHLGQVDFNAMSTSTHYHLVRMLRWLLGFYGGSARASELSQVEDVARQLLRSRTPSFSGVTLGGCKIELASKGGKQRICVYREGSGEGLPVLPIAPGQEVDWDGRRFAVHAANDAPAGAQVRALGLQGWADVKEAVPELAQLKWPAAAVATLPAVVLQGDVVSNVGISCALRVGKWDVTADVRQAWDLYHAGRGAGFRAVFNRSVVW